MTIATSEIIAEFRSQLANYPEALAALNTLEDCEGDLEDAAIVLAIRAGQEPDVANSEWLKGLAHQCRGVICDPALRQPLLEQNIEPGYTQLITTPLCPDFLASLVLLYAIQDGIGQFCGALSSDY